MMISTTQFAKAVESCKNQRPEAEIPPCPPGFKTFHNKNGLTYNAKTYGILEHLSRRPFYD